MQRSIRFGLLLSSAEKQALARLAEAAGGLSQGALIRSLIRQEAHRRGLWHPDDQAPSPTPPNPGEPQ
mgnify:CR=1 FL=1